MQLDRDALIAARETLMMELKSMKEETSAAPGSGGCFMIFHDFSMEKWWFSMEKWWFSMEKCWFNGISTGV